MTATRTTTQKRSIAPVTRDGGVDASVTPDTREAATVMLVRDAPDLEVFMLRRNLASAWHGGVYVFPGGAVDPGDRDDAVSARCLDLDEELPLPPELAVGKKVYDEFKTA